jgi:hypothetical protein
MHVMFCVPGREYPVADKRITARVRTDDGRTLYFRMSDHVPLPRLLPTVRVLVHERGGMRYQQPEAIDQ